MKNIIKRFKEIKEISKSGTDIFKDFTLEDAQRTCREFRKTMLLISIVLLLVSIIVLAKWKLTGTIILLLSLMYIIGYFIYYQNFKKYIYSRIQKRQS
jgi:hypothetical protein